MEPFTLTDKKTGQKYTVYANSKQEAAQVYKSGDKSRIQPVANQVQDQLDTDKLIQSYNQQQSYMQPYREGLEDLINNYDDLQKQALNRDKWLTGMSILSGNPEFKNMIGKYNPAEQEATRLDLVNKLAQNKIAEEQGVNTITGMAKTMQRAGLPPEMALVDPSMIGKLSNILSAQTAAEARKYSADLNYKARLLDSYLDNAIRDAISKRNVQLATQLQYMRNKNNLQRAYLQQIPWTDDYSTLNYAMGQFGMPINMMAQQPVVGAQPTQRVNNAGSSQPINNSYGNAYQKILGY